MRYCIYIKREAVRSAFTAPSSRIALTKTRLCERPTDSHSHGKTRSCQSSETRSKPNRPDMPSSLAGTGLIDLKEAARAAGLRYVSDRSPGIRVRVPNGFGYRYPDGRRVTDQETLT